MRDVSNRLTYLNSQPSADGAVQGDYKTFMRWFGWRKYIIGGRL